MDILLIRRLYIDASALVKLVADDDAERTGREIFRDYYWSHAAHVYATQYCVAEAFAAFKRKLSRKELSLDKYIEHLQAFIRLGVGHNLRIDESLSILSPVAKEETERLIRKYGIDFLDSYQIAVMKHGDSRAFDGGSKPLLITADRELSKAVRAEGFPAWYIIDEQAPADERGTLR